jgi:NAD(P)-dependent dehydrogenase (short-subunit alcohol dehydrogenase family)
MFPGGDGLPQGAPGPTRSITAGRLAVMTEEPRVAVITGGASGIGLATAWLLAEQGWRLVLADVEAPRLDAACAELGAGDQVAGVVTDVGVKESVDALAAASFERFGRVDVVFNNAGVAIGGLTVDMSHADWAWLMQVNLWGPIHGVEAFLPRLVEQGSGGHLLFTASFAGLAPNVWLGPYCVTKYGVVALAEVLHRELRTDGIGVSVLCPMRVATEINRSSRNRPAELGGTGEVPPPTLTPDDDQMAGRVLPVEEVAKQVVAAIGTDRLYIVPHAESRAMIRRRFERIDQAFEG